MLRSYMNNSIKIDKNRVLRWVNHVVQSDIVSSHGIVCQMKCCRKFECENNIQSSKIDRVPRDIQGEKRGNNMANSGKLVSCKLR